MKKRIILFVIIILISTIIGTSIWLIIKRNNVKPLYEVNSKFIVSSDTTDLTDKMATAQNLYSSILSSENRITVLRNVILKLDSFEKDLNSYLVLSSSDNKTAKNLSRSYSKLIKTRDTLITDYNEYITRMSGDINADGIPAPLQNLYNELFNKTVDYLYTYNDCFKSTSTYVFDKVYTVDTVKTEVYNLYSLGVSNLLNNISNNKFSSTILITRLNNGINVNNGVLNIRPTINGGEFSIHALKFRQYFNNSNLTTLIDNFNAYYTETIDPETETSNEKLAVYYAKQILEI